MSEKTDNSGISQSTVFALSTPVGGAIAVIRASGPRAKAALSAVFTGRIEPRLMSHGRITDGDAVLDECMAVFFPAPRSYTGEDMFELDLHGSLAVISAVSRLLLKQGLEFAGAGEFTKRAFLNGKMDLVQADAVMDLINAETRRSANAAMDQLRGGLSRRIALAENALIDLGSELGAALDYPDEMEDEVLSSVPEKLSPVIEALGKLAENGRAGRLLREGAKLVILGRPNAGKSSLMNALLNEDRAIVTEHAGTTRDVLEERLELCGLPVRIVDTAGLRENAGPVERIGIDRARAQAESAELILLVFDCTRFDSAPQADDLALIDAEYSAPVIHVINKTDVSPEKAAAFAAFIGARRSGASTVLISCKTRDGLDRLAETAAESLGAADGGALVTNERHIERILFAKSELEKALALSDAELLLTLLASALSALGEITGREFSEELLDRIFSRFCVGK